MSNMQPVIPRFYCDHLNWLIHTGRMATTDVSISNLSMKDGSSVIEMFDNTPSNLQIIASAGVSTQCVIKMDTNVSGGTVQDINFIAILGHNFLDADVKFSLEQAADARANPTTVTLTDVRNLGTNDAGTWTADNNGWTLATFTPIDANNEEFRIIIDVAVGGNYDAEIQIGCILLGRYVDAPHRPDVSLQLSLDQENKLIQTDGGMTYSNMKARSAPDWYLAPYEVGTGSTPTIITRSGRYIHDWSFSYVADSNLIPDDFQTSTNLLTGTTMFNILQYTAGSHFPCLIQMDSTSVKDTGEYLFSRIHQQGAPVSTSPNTWMTRWRIVEEY